MHPHKDRRGVTQTTALPERMERLPPPEGAALATAQLPLGRQRLIWRSVTRGQI